MDSEPIESYLIKRRPKGDAYEPMTGDFASEHPDDDYPPIWTYGPWWADFVLCAYLLGRTIMAFTFDGPDDVALNVNRSVWVLSLVVMVIVATYRFRERRRWRLPKATHRSTTAPGK